MKKTREGKENRRNGANFFKYVQPQAFSLSQQSKIHSRSLMDLDQNTSRYQQSARGPSSKEIHHTSLAIPADQPENETVKSHSLKKFLSIFGGPANLNPATYRRVSVADDKPTPKTAGRQVFTCNIKNMNVNVTNNREKDHKQSTTLPISKREKSDSHQSLYQSKPSSQDLIFQLKRHIGEGKETQKRLRAEVDYLKKENQTLRFERDSHRGEKAEEVERSKLKQAALQNKINQLERSLEAKEKCREHELIIQSLKKVINQQLKKIIELQKLKVQRQEIQKLQENINKNMNIVNQTSARQKLKLIENNDFLRIKRKEGRNIKIEDEEISETELSSPINQYQIYSETIEEVTEEEEKDSTMKLEEGQEDSILEEVDKYLEKWRNHS